MYNLFGSNPSSPIWEKDFSIFSYGFWPKRSAHDALKQANKYINAGRHWIIDLDLKSFFDRVHHDKLMSLISQRVADKILLRLIRRYLQSGLLKAGKVQTRREGTPQGGPLSPLLSNILLNKLDKELEKRGHGFVSSYKKGDRGKYRLWIAKKIWQRLKEKIKIITRKTSPIPFEERIERLNRLMYGWVNYFMDHVKNKL